MTNKATVARLFELAIELEESAQELYHELGQKFVHHPKAANFWKQYAVEEAGHAKWLASLRDDLSTKELAASADTAMIEAAREMLEFPIKNKLARVTDLRDAYQLAKELENSETNVIFEFLITHFSANEKTRNFLRSHLKDHIGKLMLWFPTQFDVAEESSV
ncbi:MAG: hypothetical protein GY832_31470 [Chloroflexi bacterium]|nr:hypothetical protein [Chloroflexota bacterium]